MPTVVGVRFKDSGKIYYFDPQDVTQLVQGDAVIVETVRGPELARIASEPKDVVPSEIVGELKPVVRRADQSDLDRLQHLNSRHDEIMGRCSEKIVEHNLPMRLVKAEYSFDGSRLTFYFTAEKRVDFRVLVRDLARTFRARIELRQIGPRDEAKLLGGIGPCGRLLCCATFLPDYARVSIKMAKDQDLPLNPSKISGVCGRLLCCLSYEHDQYVQIKAELPHKGAWVQTPDGPGEVVNINVVRETVTVMLAESGAQEEFKPDLLQEATEKVASIARSRNAEGITPAARQERPHREPKHHGERRLLRDEIDNPEVLDALALLEEGDWDESRDQRDSRAHVPQADADIRPRAPNPGQSRLPESPGPKPRQPLRLPLLPNQPKPQQGQPPETDMPKPAPKENDQFSRNQQRRRRKR